MTIQNFFSAFRFKLFFSHFFLGILVLGGLTALFWFNWYAWPAWYLSGAAHIFVLILGVDLTVGPIVTFLVADPRKPRRNLVMDLSVVAIIQICALAWGAHAAWVGRPIYTAFAVDKFVVTQANQIPDEEWRKAQNTPFAQRVFKPMQWVLAKLPDDLNERLDIVNSAMSEGVDINGMPRYFKPLEQGREQILAHAISYEQLQDVFKRNDVKVPLPTFKNPLQIGALPIQGNSISGVLLINKTTLEPAGFVDADPFGFQSWPQVAAFSEKNPEIADKVITVRDKSTDQISPKPISSFALFMGAMVLLIVFVWSRRHPKSLLLTLLACSVCIPALMPFHTNPQTVFYSEWTASCFIALTLFALLVMKRETLAWRFSSLSLAMFGLALAAALSGAFHPNGAVAAAMGMGSYLGLGIVAVGLGVMISQITGREACTQALAAGALAGALLQCVMSVAQLSGWSWGGLVMTKLLNSVYGNVAQPNHFADLLWIGMVSGFYLWKSQKLPSVFAFVIAVCLCLFSALSASRAALLYTAVFPLLVFLLWRNCARQERHSAIEGAVVVTGLSVLMQLWVAFGGASELFGVASGIGRLGDTGSNTQRLFDWLVAWKTGNAMPLWGTGVGHFSWETALASKGLDPLLFNRVGENAHNTPLQILAEFGWIVFILFFGLMLWWCVRQFKAKFSLETFWGLGVIAIVATHSMVEYPLWYTYFMIPVCFAAGVVDAGNQRLPTLRLSSRWMFLPLAAIVGVMIWTWQDFRAIELAHRMIYGRKAVDVTEQVMEESRELAQRVKLYSMFGAYAANSQMYGWNGQPASSFVPEAAALCDTLARTRPSYQTLPKCVTAYFAMDREQDARELVNILCSAYPRSMTQQFSMIAPELFKIKGWPLELPSGCAPAATEAKPQNTKITDQSAP